MEFMILFGFLAAFITSIANVPQTVKCFKTKQTRDISLMMYIMLATGMAMWIIYGIFIKDLPLIIANIFSISLVLSIIIMKLIYK